MADFRKVAEEAKRSSEQRRAEARAKEKAMHEENRRRFQERVQALRAMVMDLLKEAAQACTDNGVQPHLQDNFKETVEGHTPDARIEFWCSGHHGAVSSARAIFSYGDAGARMRLSASARGDCFDVASNPEEGVKTALERVLDTYFRAIEHFEAERSRP